MSLVNKALVGKLTWRFLTDPDAIWVKLLKAKYLKQDDFWSHSKPALASSNWKGITSMRTMIKDGYCWSVGDGKNICIWDDPWIPDLPGFRVTRPQVINNRPIFWVCNLFIPNAKAWDTVLIRTLFDPAAAHAILKIPIPQSVVPDKIIWTKTTNEIFTTKSLYRSLADLHGSTSMIQSYSSTTFPWSLLTSLIMFLMVFMLSSSEESSAQATVPDQSVLS
ncbi:hypothetical protein BVC80_41g54 [Macleaya cordata]|uniref:Reverse transcriptase zinc-binding domain n=1 Tax=Macleaya cordata TaxID=56857 RepID=A0A200QMW5_MACCD|nr:hypothetical protein BVC80_41g54 [Macleaya cordata]